MDSDATSSAQLLQPVLTIAGPLTIATVETWRQQIVARLSARSDITIDVAGLTQVDVFGVQLLLAARVAAEHTHRALHVLNAPELLRTTCAEAGFDPAHFAAPVATSS